MTDQNLLRAHRREATRRRALITNEGWSEDETGIISGTSRGMLVSERLNYRHIVHEWTTKAVIAAK